MDDDDFEDELERLQNENEKILGDFINLTVGKQKKGKRKMNQAAEALRFFSESHLDHGSLLEGLEYFPGFVGDLFLRKCMWADERSLRQNMEAFALFADYLRHTQLIPAKRIEAIERTLAADCERYLLRVKAYNNPDIDLEDIRTEDGDWDDEAILALAQEDGGSAPSPNAKAASKAPVTLDINLLFSAATARFLELKPPQIIKLREWGDWNDPSHHWSSNWRCEDCFGMAKTKERILIVSNHASRYSFLLRVAPGDMKGFLTNFNKRLLGSFKEFHLATPRTVSLNIVALSGSAPSITSFQNGQRSYLDAVVDGGNFQYLEDLQERLNRVPVKIPHTSPGYEFPEEQFAKLCQQDSPFPPEPPLGNVLMFPN